VICYVVAGYLSEIRRHCMRNHSSLNQLPMPQGCSKNFRTWPSRMAHGPAPEVESRRCNPMTHYPESCVQNPESSGQVFRTPMPQRLYIVVVGWRPGMKVYSAIFKFPEVWVTKSWHCLVGKNSSEVTLAANRIRHWDSRNKIRQIKSTLCHWGGTP
jgi:hypothetical protein